MTAIQRFALQVAERFQPDKIILFGSHAYGQPHADSDVDILVIMSARNRHAQAVKIREAVPRPFALDLLIRTPKDMEARLASGDVFHTEIVTRGKVLYEAGDARVGRQGRGRLRRGGRTPKKRQPAS